MVAMPVSEAEWKRIRAETAALKDAARRIAHNDIDWAIYAEGQLRPKIAWWRRLLDIPPKGF